MAGCLMFQGTGSSVGKSVLVAGVARALTNRGYRVLPFKPQNMSNNAAVTRDGGEIGRAQALQAMACRVDPVVHMNPVLLKPQSITGAQIIVQGKIWGQAKAKAYQDLKPRLLEYVKESFERLSQQADIILIEGAGSASEINLRRHDIANMGFAEAVNAPVILIGDIDRGGVIASLIGTHAVLSTGDLKRVKGFIVNKMRGDPSLFMETMGWISARTRWQNIGLLPYFPDLRKLPAEDAMDLRETVIDRKRKGKLRISVLLLPMVSNFDDFDPLRYEPNVQLEFVSMGQPVPMGTDVIILPGSKNTIADLQALYKTGWDIDIRAHVRQGNYVFGICGGYQMLGNWVSDQCGVESTVSSIKGLGLLKISTELTAAKRLKQVNGHLFFKRLVCHGYEMHVGKTIGETLHRPFAYLEHRCREGAVSDDGRILGTYLHGIFHCDETREGLLHYFGSNGSGLHYVNEIDFVLDNWATYIEQHLSIRDLLAMQEFRNDKKALNLKD